MTQASNLSKTALKAVVDLRQAMQKQRIAFGNQVSAIARGADATSEVPGGESGDVLNDFFEEFERLEELLDQYMFSQVKDQPIVQALIGLKGIGPILATKLVTLIDITVPQTVSALWRYAGQGVTEGAADRRRKGERLCFNMHLKTVCFLIGDSFLKSRSPYRAIYDEAKAEYAVTKPDWTPMHRDRAARRKMIKLFLAHLYEAWRGLEGLPVREPYVFDQLGHTTKRERKEFGWTI